MNLFGLIPHNFLGIDIGTSAIRLVEISSWAGRKKLESYGEIPASVLYKKPYRTFEKNTLLFSNDDIARAIQAVIDEAGMKADRVVFSIPDFSTFFTNFELPPMTDREIPQAIRSEARRHIPLPLSEVALDWQIIPQPQNSKSKEIRILLVAVPNETINKYKSISKKLDLEMLGLEAEVFGMTRSLISEQERRAVALIDIGGRSTSCSIMYRGILRRSHSFDASGGTIVERLSKSLGINREEAESKIKKFGILGKESGYPEATDVKGAIEPVISLMVNEIGDTFQTFQAREGTDVEKIILAGGTALLPGLNVFFQRRFPEKEIKIANPFEELYFPPILSQRLRMIGPSYAIATGMALKGLE
jgi:type IV pilus assembly protein PilM